MEKVMNFRHSAVTWVDVTRVMRLALVKGPRVLRGVDLEGNMMEPKL
jgi:hypothetical protein